MSKLRHSLMVGIILSTLAVAAAWLAFNQRPSANPALGGLVILVGIASAISALRTLAKFAPGSRWMMFSLMFTIATAVVLAFFLFVAVFRINLGG